MENEIIKQDGESNWEKARTIEFGKKDEIKVGGKLVPLDRGGMNNNKLAEILTSNQDQDNIMRAIADYCVQNNQDSLSFLAEAFRTKGHLTKETRQFSSRMREDYEAFVATFSIFLRDTADRIWKALELKLSLQETLEKYEKDKILTGFISKEKTALVMLAISFYSEASHLEGVVKKITERREREKGKGIYYDKLGRAHSLYEENIVDIIKAEKEELTKQ